jgi:hypothetical protein
VAVPFRIQAPGRVTVDAVVTVQVQNLGLPAAAADRLLYSNDPESVFATGLLYQAAAEAGEVSRLFFHHQNRAGRPLRFVASLVNPNDTAVDCLLTAGTGGPHGDPVLAGSRAAARFLAQYRDSAGVVVQIPPRGTRILDDRFARELDTVSGIIDVRPLTGAPVICQIQALGPGKGDTGTGASLAAARDTAEIYRPAHKEFTARYTLGGRWLFLDIGQAPVARIDGQGHLHGDYGVMYSVDIELVNPLPTTQRVMLALAPRGGWARGAFLVDGRVVEIGAGYPPTECPIATVRLEPGETKRVTVATFPAGGSSYPAWLVARPAATAAGQVPGWSLVVERVAPGRPVVAGGPS